MADEKKSGADHLFVMGSGVLGVLALWLSTCLLRDVVRNLDLRLGPLGRFPLDAPWVPVIIGFLVSLAPSGVLKIRQMLASRYKGPSAHELLLRVASHFPAESPGAEQAQSPKTVANAPLNPGAPAQAPPGENT